MAKLSVNSINYVVFDRKSTILNLDITTGSKTESCSYILDINQQDSVLLQDNNHFSVILDNNTIIHNMYEFSSMLFQVDIQNKSSNSETTYESDSFIDLYGPTEVKPLGFCKLGSIIYGLSDLTRNDAIYKSTTHRTDDNNVSTDYSYSYTLKELNINPTFYKDLSTITSNDPVNILTPEKMLTNFKQNYLYEIPANTKFQDFDNGCILGDFYICKNEKDNKYDVKFTGSRSSGYQLNNARIYSDINTCGGLVYLIYSNITYNYNTPAENDIRLFEQKDSTQVSLNYPKVEIIDSSVKFNNPTHHKSNFYSIKIANSGLNTLTSYNGSTTNLTSIQNKLKQDIRNMVNVITDSLAPAHTRLVDVIFEGK